ncbi:riboflavin synthase [Halorubrum ezzemoulense]|uniref:Riboflavin synthase n=2 Tax=Halorubrum ezzemoulense TaxID=337243 RepID=A0A238XVJ5_HALEZ|nr:MULTISPECIES: riboflavin synthase [Halorubrum]MDB2245869.1 riboflavin synthase [Halorubrum ezzemoulense]MDB2252865.1 riboflavin synthase [Halorubrum ezzemoulense]MDB2279517.1 riboflavin synthase [Halorubrum ezzemoulense]MDB2286887.1 riboflavin synthase [Halorubrum ezzemoulense]MDB2289714.1 riboflavin synthase [Halorubrum ezzemoulense]
MFTGIVEGTGTVRERTETDDGLRLRIGVDGFDDLHHGQSISVSGVCLTVEEHGSDDGGTTDGGDWFSVFLASETVAKTYLGGIEAEDAVNVERAMPADGRFDGHVVQGHVDTVAEVTGIERVGEDWRFTFATPEGHGDYLVDKGSVTLDGISLTVAEKRAGEFDVAVIPTTYDLTTLSEKSVGDPVHLEVDVIAKYVENMLDGYAAD